MSYSSRERLTRWVRWTDMDGYPWHVGLTWAKPDGAPSRLVGLELWATPPGSDRVDLGPEEDPSSGPLAHLETPDLAAVTSRLLHDFPLKRVAAPARDDILDALRAAPLPSGGEIRALVECRQARYPYGHYEAVADIYRQAVAVGDDPLVAIREAHPWASRRAVASWVYRCRHILRLLEPVD